MLESEQDTAVASEPAAAGSVADKPTTAKPASPSKNVRYSRYNLHYYAQGQTCRASYTNWTDCPGHAFLPYNTAFKMGLSGRRNTFELISVDTGLAILFEFSSPNMGGMSPREYFNMITSPTPVSYPNLSEVDQEGASAGRAMLGMSKEGVMIALGYPAKSMTPSTDLNTWTYSRNRFRQLTVTFSNDGKVESLR